MKDWYLRQTSRDRMIVLVLATLCVLSLLYAAGWYPLQSRLQSNRLAIANKLETLEFVRDAAVRINAENGGQAEQRQSNKAPYLLIDEIIRKAGISPPERVEPSGADGARVQFNEVAFDGLVKVLAELELYGLKVATMNITRKNAGTVSARFNMERS